MLKVKSILATIGLGVAMSATWAADITGAGATFPFPIYAKWAEGYKAATGTGTRQAGKPAGSTEARKSCGGNVSESRYRIRVTMTYPSHRVNFGALAGPTGTPATAHRLGPGRPA